MENNHQNLLVLIAVCNNKPRLALPIRAIPFVELWRRFSPDVIPKYLTQKTFSSVNSTFTAYKLLGDSIRTVQPHEWEVVNSSMETYAAQVFHRFKIKMNDRGKATIIKKVAHAAWSKGVIRYLPHSWFVWWDEFQKEFAADSERVIFLSGRLSNEGLIFDPIRYQSSTKMLMSGFTTFGGKNRTYILDEVIGKAQIECGSSKMNDVWVRLKEMALEEVKPFTGRFSEKNLEYTDTNEKVAEFSRNALKMYLLRQKDRQNVIYIKHVK